jgi:hypothetical protein
MTDFDTDFPNSTLKMFDVRRINPLKVEMHPFQQGAHGFGIVL